MNRPRRRPIVLYVFTYATGQTYSHKGTLSGLVSHFPLHIFIIACVLYLNLYQSIYILLVVLLVFLGVARLDIVTVNVYRKKNDPSVSYLLSLTKFQHEHERRSRAPAVQRSSSSGRVEVHAHGVEFTYPQIILSKQKLSQVLWGLFNLLATRFTDPAFPQNSILRKQRSSRSSLS